MATINGSSSKNNYAFWITVDETLPSDYISRNASHVSVTVWIGNRGRRFDSSHWSRKLNVDGSDKIADSEQHIATTDVDANTGDKVLFSWEGEIAHNNDGTKTIYVGAKIEKSNPSSYDPGNCYAEGYVTLTSIPRKAVLETTYDFNDDQNPVFYFSNPENFYLGFALEYDNLSKSITRMLDYAPSSPYTFVLTEEERDTLRKACASDSMSIRMTVATSIAGTFSQWSWQDKTFYRKRRIYLYPQTNVGKWADPYVYTNGAYRRCIPYVYKDGSWKKGTS